MKILVIKGNSWFSPENWETTPGTTKTIKRPITPIETKNKIIGYVKAPRISWDIFALLSKKSEVLFKMYPNSPEVSPALTREQKRLSNTLGCSLKDSDNLNPDSPY